MKGRTILATSLVLAMVAPSAWALVGGPWDHLITNKFSRNNPDGLYEASVTMRNGSGFVRFTQGRNQTDLDDPIVNEESADLVGTPGGGGAGGGGGTILTPLAVTTTTNTLASSSNSAVFFKGESYFGNTYGSVNATGGSVTGVTSGTSQRFSTLEASFTGQAAAANALVDVNGLESTFNMNFSGRMTQRYPQIQFEATGKAAFFEQPPASITFSGLEDLLNSGLYDQVLQQNIDSALAATDAEIAVTEQSFQSNLSLAQQLADAQIALIQQLTAAGLGPTDVTLDTSGLTTSTTTFDSDTLAALIDVDSLVTAASGLTELNVDASGGPTETVSVRLFGGRISVQSDFSTADGNQNPDDQTGGGGTGGVNGTAVGF